MTSLSNTCRWFPAGIHKLDNNSHVNINAFELLHVITEYLVCFFNDGCYRELFIILFSIFLDKFQFSTDKLTNFDEVLLKAYIPNDFSSAYTFVFAFS